MLASWKLARLYTVHSQEKFCIETLTTFLYVTSEERFGVDECPVYIHAKFQDANINNKKIAR